MQRGKDFFFHHVETLIRCRACVVWCVQMFENIVNHLYLSSFRRRNSPHVLYIFQTLSTSPRVFLMCASVWICRTSCMLSYMRRKNNVRAPMNYETRWPGRYITDRQIGDVLVFTCSTLNFLHILLMLFQWCFPLWLWPLLHMYCVLHRLNSSSSSSPCTDLYVQLMVQSIYLIHIQLDYVVLEKKMPACFKCLWVEGKIFIEYVHVEI